MKLEDWCEEAERVDERALRREAILEVIGGILLAIEAIVFFWLYLVATPPQRSAECDRLYELMEKSANGPRHEWRGTGQETARPGERSNAVRPSGLLWIRGIV